MKRLILLTVEYQGKQLTVLAEDEIDEVSGGQFPLQSVSLPALPLNGVSTLDAYEMFRSLLRSGDDEFSSVPDNHIIKH
jgi:hypothetical protein